MTFPVGDGSPPPGRPQSLEELPLVYVVTALTALNEDERKLVDGWSDLSIGRGSRPARQASP